MKKYLILIVLLLVNVNVLSNETSRSAAQKEYYSSQYKQVKQKMFIYMLNHKMATAAVVATGGGLSLFLENSMDEDTKTGLAIVGLVGLFYCIDSSDECAQVASKLLAYSIQLKLYETKISALN